MSKTSSKLILSLTGFFVSFPLMAFSGWFGLGVLIGLVLSILYWFDFAGELPQSSPASSLSRSFVLLMSIPQLIFGLLCVGIGVTIIGWVLYNTFVEKQPQYSGGFLTLGIGPVLVLLGASWASSVFRRGSGGPDGA